MENTDENKYKKRNIKIYPYYKMVSWDLLFYYPIIYLYLIQIKHFSASQALLLESFYTAFCLFLQIPIGIIVDRRGKRNSLILANIFLSISTCMILIGNTFNEFLLLFFIQAIAFVIKGHSEINILYDSIPADINRGKTFSVIDGKGSTKYYIMEAVSSVASSLTYVINPYLPIICCLTMNIIATILAIFFHSLKDNNEKNLSIKGHLKEFKEVYSFAINSPRLRSLLLYFGLISGLLYSINTYRSTILYEISVPEQYFGLILMISQVVSSIFAKLQNSIHKRFTNKTLTVLGIPLTFAYMIIGIIGLYKHTLLCTFLIILLIILIGGIKGAYYVLIIRYLNNFTNKRVRVKLSIIRNMIYNIFTIFITLIGSILLSFTSAANTILVIGCISSICLILLLDFMRDKVGLKPEEYKQSDLKYSNVKINEK